MFSFEEPSAHTGGGLVDVPEVEKWLNGFGPEVRNSVHLTHFEPAILNDNIIVAHAR